MLRDLLKQTPPDHPDCSNLRQAIDVIQRLCDRIDECTEKAATMQHMMDRWQSHETYTTIIGRDMFCFVVLKDFK